MHETPLECFGRVRRGVEFHVDLIPFMMMCTPCVRDRAAV